MFEGIKVQQLALSTFTLDLSTFPLDKPDFNMDNLVSIPDIILNGLKKIKMVLITLMKTR